MSEDKRPSTWICKKMQPAKMWLPQKIHSVTGARVVFVIFSMTTKTLAFSWFVHQRLVAAGIAVSQPAMLSVNSSAKRQDRLILGSLYAPRCPSLLCCLREG
jgi:hypothetical protein